MCRLLVAWDVLPPSVKSNWRQTVKPAKRKRERTSSTSRKWVIMNEWRCVIVPSLTIERKVRLHKDKLTILSEKEGTPFPVTPVESWWRKFVKAISLGNKTANANKDQPITRKMKTYPQFLNLFSSHSNSQYFYSMNSLSFIIKSDSYIIINLNVIIFSR